MRFVGVIPVRYGSTRLPGKPLIEIAGRTLVEWVHRHVLESSELDEVYVATDDARIAEKVRSFGGKAIMTRPDHVSGTDRVAEVAASIEADFFVNVQGDEPLIAPSTIAAVCAPLRRGIDLPVSTAKIALTDSREIESPDTVKVVTDREGRALYFSRCPIPFRNGGQAAVYKHLGIYAYRRDFLLDVPDLAVTPLERAESLEQLRFLENGVGIQVEEVFEDSPGIDTREDLELVRPLLENRNQSSSSIDRQRERKRG